MAGLTLRKARAIIKATLAKAREMELKPIAVVVLDAAGHVVAAEREDGASPGRIPLAEAKAHGVIMLDVPGSVLKARAESGAAGAAFLAAANGVFGGKLVPVPGGVQATDARGAVLGAVGVSGDTSERDAEAALAGLAAAGLSGVA